MEPKTVPHSGVAPHWHRILTRSAHGNWVIAGLVGLILGLPPNVQAYNREAKAYETRKLTIKQGESTREATGEVLAAYSDGSLLFLSRDGQLRTLLSEEVVSSTPTAAPMEPMLGAEVGQSVIAELPPGFKVTETKHYVLVYNTSDIYVDWVGKLFERLYRGFYNYWRNKGVKLEEPRFPLVAIVFSDKAGYMAYAEREVGEAAGAMIGYYNMKTNRVITYDLTGVDGLVPTGQRVSSQVGDAPQCLAGRHA